MMITIESFLMFDTAGDDALPDGLAWHEPATTYHLRHYIADLSGRSLALVKRDGTVDGSPELRMRPDIDRLIALMRRKNGLT